MDRGGNLAIIARSRPIQARTPRRSGAKLHRQGNDRCSLLDLDPGVPDEGRILRDVRSNRCAERRRRFADRLVPVLQQALPGLVAAQASASASSSLAMTAGGTPAGATDRTMVRSRSPKIPVRDRRQIRCARPRALSPAPPAGAACRSLACGSDERQIGEHMSTCPPTRSATAGAAPLYGISTMSTPAIDLKSSAAQPRAAAGAAGAIGQPSGMQSGVRDQFRDRPHRHFRIHRERVGNLRDAADGDEVADRVVRQVPRSSTAIAKLFDPPSSSV